MLKEGYKASGYASEELYLDQTESIKGKEIPVRTSGSGNTHCPLPFFCPELLFKNRWQLTRIQVEQEQDILHFTE